MLPSVRGALGRLWVRSMAQQVSKRSKLKKQPDFHDSYGVFVLAGGVAFCFVTWSYLLTHYDLEYYLSPVGRVRPKDWRKQ